MILRVLVMVATMFMYCCNTPILSNYRKITYQSTGNTESDFENNDTCKADPKN